MGKATARATNKPVPATIVAPVEPKPVSVFRDIARNVIDPANAGALVAAYLPMAEVMAKGMGGEVPQRTLDEAAAIIRSIPGDGQQVDIERATALASAARGPVTFENKEGPATTLPLVDRLSAMSAELREAVAIGEAFDDETVADIVRAPNAKEELDSVPVLVARDLLRLEKEGKFGERKIIDMPKPKLRWDSDEYKAMGDKPNVMPDYYKGNDGKTAGSHWENVVLSMAPGKECDEIYKLLQVLANKSTNDENSGLNDEQAERLRTLVTKQLGGNTVLNSLVDKALGADSDAVGSLRKRNGTRITTMAGKLRVAVTLIQQWHRAEEAGFYVSYVADTPEAAALLRDPIILRWKKYDGKTGEPIKFKDGSFDLSPSTPISVGTFNKYDITKAVKDAKAKNQYIAWSHLKETVKRTPKTDTNATGTQGQTPTAAAAKATEIRDKLQWVEYMYSVARYVSGTDRKKQLVALCNDGTEGKEITEALGDLYYRLEDVMADIQASYDLIKAEKNRQKQLEDAEKLKALGQGVASPGAKTTPAGKPTPAAA